MHVLQDLDFFARCDDFLVGQAVSPGVSSSDVHSRGVSPLWTVMTGTIRLGKGVRREAGSEES